jgi:serine/threonine-protein kinase
VDLGRRVAIKLIHPRHQREAEAVSRLRREARIASSIESDYVLQCFDIGEDAEHGLYIVSEYLEGEDLEQRLARTGRLDVATAVTIGVQAALGLARAHERGVIHRDLKPANIFLTKRHDHDALLVKVLDFGISKLAESALRKSEETPTGPGLALGTPSYMSPEQALGMRPLDGRTDVWSLAAVLYECICGEPLFGDRPIVEILLALTKAEIPRLHDVAPWVPAEVADTIHAALVRDREARTPDARAFARRLAEASKVALDAPHRQWAVPVSGSPGSPRVCAGGEDPPSTKRAF